MVVRSSTEAEYRALAHVAAEIACIKSLLSEIKVPMPIPPVVWCNNLGAATMASNHVYHARTKHVEIDLHFVGDMVLRKELEIRYVPTVDQTADVLTKALSVSRFLKLRNKLKIEATPSNLRG